jgi:hypothetical protein
MASLGEKFSAAKKIFTADEVMAFLTSENKEKETPEDDSALFDTSVEVQEPPEICHSHDSESCTEMPTDGFLLPEEVCDTEDDNDSICEVSQTTENEVSIVNQRPAEDDSLFFPESDSNSSTGFYDSPNSTEGQFLVVPALIHHLSLMLNQSPWKLPPLLVASGQGEAGVEDEGVVVEGDKVNEGVVMEGDEVNEDVDLPH